MSPSGFPGSVRAWSEGKRRQVRLGMVSSVGLGFGGGMGDVSRGEAPRGWSGWTASRLKPGGLPPAPPLLPRQGSQPAAVAGSWGLSKKGRVTATWRSRREKAGRRRRGMEGSLRA